jgi:hypothetical protein
VDLDLAGADEAAAHVGVGRQPAGTACAARVAAASPAAVAGIDRLWDGSWCGHDVLVIWRRRREQRGPAIASAPPADPVEVLTEAVEATRPGDTRAIDQVVDALGAHTTQMLHTWPAKAEPKAAR